MPIQRDLGLWLAALHRDGGPALVRPLTLPSPFGVGRAPGEVADEVAAALRTGWMRHPDHLALLSAGADLELVAETLTVTVRVPPAGPRDAEVSTRFDVALGAAPGGGVVAFVPALDLVVHGADRDEAREVAGRAITAELARSKRLDDPGELLESQWFTRLDLHREIRPLPWHTFAERRAFEAGVEADTVLPSVAEALPRGRAFEMDEARRDLRAALSARHTAGVVLVGPPGTGKTTLLRDEAGRPKSAFGGTVWSTSAARLANGLTQGGPWQEALIALCEEIPRGDWLHVADLADLFEVGRYVGNDVSMGEALRPLLARSAVALVTECTPERLAAIEARYPGFAELLHRVDVPAPDDARLERTVVAWARHASRRFEDVTAVIRLQRRFTPYAGYPARTVRFLDGLARGHAGPVTRAEAIERYCAETGVPRELVDPDVALPVGAFRARIEAALFGQPSAVAALLAVVTSIKADLAPRGRPIASLLLVGPTGVGKTEAARVLAETLFHDRARMVRFDMSEFATPDAVLRLTASPEPHGEGLLTGAVRRRPFAVLLLDEVEKAHPDFFDLLLQVLGEGRLTDHQGRLADFGSMVVVMTSNLGADRLARGRAGFGAPGVPLDALTDAVHAELRPELVNRIDRIVTFGPLDRDAVLRVLDRELDALARHPALAVRGARLEVTPAARLRLAERGHDPARGARPLQRVLRDEVMAPIAVALDAEPTASLGFIVDVGPDLIVRRTVEPRAAVRERGADAEERAFRLDFARLLAGPALADHAMLRSEVERLVPAVVRGEHPPDRLRRALAELGVARPSLIEALDEVRAPIVDLDRVAHAASDLAAHEVAAELDGSPFDGEPEALRLEERSDVALQRVLALVHPPWQTVCVGLYSPGVQPVDEIARWVAGHREACAPLGLALRAFDLWWVDGAYVTGPEDRPYKGAKWVGREVWLTGPAAWLLVYDVAGLYDVTRRGGDLRILVDAAFAPGDGRAPSCCGPLNGRLRALPQPRGADPWDRYELPRTDLLRLASYEGGARPWRVSPSRLVAEYRWTVYEHADGRDG